MNKKIIMPIALVTLLSLAVFVSAYMEQIQGDEDRITYTASVRQGWNLLNAGTIVFNELALTDNSNIQPEDIGAVFYYSPSQKEYIQIYPNLDEEKFNIEDGRNAQTYLIESSSAWVYVKRDGMIEYETDDVISMTKRKLTSGWNFVSVTENALGQSLNDLKGDCNIQKAYYYLEGYQELDLNMDFPTDMSSQGLLIKVSNSCQFGGSSVTPPQIPQDNIGCTDSDGGANYDVKGVVTDSRGEHEDYCSTSSISQNLVEYSCSGNSYTSSSYICPNGCSNGACL